MTAAAATTLPTPLGRRVKVVEQGAGTPVVFLHRGVGSAGEWKDVFSLWPEGYRLVAIEAYRGGTGPGVAGRRSLDAYADHVYAVADHVGVSICLVGFSWGGATALRVAAGARARELARRHRARGLRVAAHPGRRGLRSDLWLRAGRWYEAFEELAAWGAARAGPEQLQPRQARTIGTCGTPRLRRWP